MEKKLEKAKQPGKASKFFSSVLLTGGMLLFILKPAISKNNTEMKAELMQILKTVPVKEWKMIEPNKSVDNTVKLEIVQDNNNALDFAVQNVDKYYPDIKEHLNTMINSFRDEEHKEETIKLLNEMAAKIQDPKQKTGAIIYALERRVFSKSDFAKKYDSQITDETFDQMDIFRVEYDKRFDIYYANLLANIEQLKTEIKQKEELIKQKDEEIKQKDEEIKQKDEEIKQGLKDLENILSKFTPEDIKTNNSIRELTINTEKFYQEGGFPISEHLQSLFDATK